MMKQGKLKEKLNKILHVDAHMDSGIPGYFGSNKRFFFKTNSLHAIDEYSKKLGIAGFIAPLAETGFIADWYWLDNLKTHLANRMRKDNDHWYMIESSNSRVSSENLEYDILDIDIDVLGGEQTDEIEAQLDQFAILAQKAKVISIVTSPGFINQKLAIKYVRSLVEKIANSTPLAEANPAMKVRQGAGDGAMRTEGPLLLADLQRVTWL